MLFILFVALASFAAGANAASCGCCEISSSGVLTSCRGCPASTTSLHLANCGITSLQPGSFASPTLSNVTGLDLSNNALHDLSASAFEGLSALTLLDLSSNFISAVAPGALCGETLPLLTTLDLGFNELPSVPSSLSLPNLTSLSLYWNPIPVFSDTSFSLVPRLTYLDANNCGLSNVSLRAFAPLTALTTLNLGHNTLTELPQDGWVGPSLLTTLALQFNSIFVLPPRFFRAFPMLETLPIYSNQLVELAAGTFLGLTNLAGLYLNDNNLTTLHSGCFSGLSYRFQYLSLSGNMLSPAACNGNFASIASVPGACFASLASLQSTPPLLGVELTCVPGCLSDILPLSIGSWVTPGTSISPPLDADGWPLADAAIEVFDARPSGTPPVDPTAFVPSIYGPYRLTFQGKGVIEVPSILNFTLTSVTFDPVAWVTSATITLFPPFPALALAIGNSQRTPTSPINSGFTHLTLLQPSGSTQGVGPHSPPSTPFTPQLLTALAPFHHIRTMQWTNGFWVVGFSNASSPGVPSIEWEERMTPQRAVWQPFGGASGAPWESVVQLAQATGGKGIWINVPIQASGVGVGDSASYIHNLATLLRDGVPPSTPIYVEHSNEPWLNASIGGPSPAYLWNLDAARREVAANPTSPLAINSSNPEVWGYRRHLLRLTQISGIFKAVFAAGGSSSPILPVLSFSSSFPSELEGVLEWYRAWAPTATPPLPPLSSTLYGIAINSYAVAGIPPGVDVEGVLSALKGAVSATVAEKARASTIAAAHGLALVSYEGALVALPVLHDPPTTAVVIAANRVEGWGQEVVEWYREAWEGGGVGGKEFNFFALSSQYGEDAPMEIFQWGLTEDLCNVNTSKFRAVWNITSGGQ